MGEVKVCPISFLKNYPKFKKAVFKTAKKVFKALKINDYYIDIFLVEKNKLNFLKKRYLKSKKEATVLSFNYPKNFPHPETKYKPLGEIYLSSKIFDNKDWPKFLIHGILHLLGFNHGKKNDIIKMEKLEDKIWQKI